MKPPFTLEFDNDVGPDDGGYWEWWTLIDSEGSHIAKIDDELDAAEICKVLNRQYELVSMLIEMVGSEPCTAPDGHEIDSVHLAFTIKKAQKLISDFSP